MADNGCDHFKMLPSLNDRAFIDTLPYHEQITLNAKFQKEQIEKHFDAIKSAFNKLIDERIANLKEQVDEAEKKSLGKVQAYGEIIEDGNAMLESKTNHVANEQVEKEDVKALEELRIDKLSSTTVVPFQKLTGTILQVSAESQIVAQLKSLICSFGKISIQPLLIISDISTKSFSIAVKWKVPEDANPGDICMFMLQMLEVGSSKDYFEVYRGTQTSFVVHNLKPNQEYSFRVSRLITNCLPFWSVPKSASTLTPVLKWKLDSGCTLLNDGATLSTSLSSTSIFLSSSRSYVCGQTLVFSIEALPDDASKEEDGFGLSTMEASEIKPMDKGSLFLTCTGTICVGVQKMTTRLPTIKQGSVITFDSEKLPNNKVRVTIEIEEKVVTFDWLGHWDFQNMLEGSINLHFFARLTSPGWRITVE